MDKIEEFKSFLKTIPSIKKDVLNEKYTWQQIYEIYTMYGSNDAFFAPYKHQNNDMNILLDIIKNIDLNALSSSLQSIEKVLTMVNGLMASKNETKGKWHDE